MKLSLKACNLSENVDIAELRYSMCGLDDDYGAMTVDSWRSSEFLNMFSFLATPHQQILGRSSSLLCPRRFTKCTCKPWKYKEERTQRMGSKQSPLSDTQLISSRPAHKVFLVIRGGEINKSTVLVSKGPFRHNKTWHQTCWLKWLEPGRHGRKTTCNTA